MNFLTIQRVLALAALAALVFAGLRMRSRAIEQGEQRGRAAQAEIDERQRKQEVAVLTTLLDAKQVQIDAHRNATALALRLVERLNERVSSLEKRLAETPGEVATIPEDALFSDIRGKLGLVPVTKPPPFSTAELRTLDICVTSLPLQQQAIQLLQQEQGALRDAVMAQSQQITALETQRDATIAAYNQLTAHYITAYNAIPRRGRKWYCLFLWKCGTVFSNLSLPNPLQLQKVTP